MHVYKFLNDKLRERKDKKNNKKGEKNVFI